MDDRLAALAAVLVGASLAVVSLAEYVLPGRSVPPYEPLTTGILVLISGLLLLAAGGMAAKEALDTLALRAATSVGLVTLLLAVLQPTSLLFGGVFWLGLVSATLIGAGTYRTFAKAN
ncbi:hypothetical protein HWV23_00695 [Natronomonas halophila]|uniref:hypothetical protein n=1 Tax=Natronomonas halophila TaxID=2747817 RepID=UPI0015B6257E|nr:hypothetical protein [Natronomonas halophila]QLD84283.1 hypothetical protein HWV23_00695 [Natronomonas halophila]